MKNNYFDRVPQKNKYYSYSTRTGLVTIYVPHRGPLEKMVRFIFKKPDMSTISLDELGSYVWRMIDGKNTVYDIARRVESYYGEEAYPIYDRLVVYINHLKKNDLITI